MATPPKQPYKTSLCACCSDCGVCCWGYWCGCWLFGDTSEKLDRAAGDPNAGCCGSCLLFYLSHFLCLQGFVGCCERNKLRSQFNLQGEDCPACCAYTCCAPCATCQDAREFRLREAEVVSYAYAAQQAGAAAAAAPAPAPAPVQAEMTSEEAPVQAEEKSA